MISINLLPDVKVEYLKTQRVKYRFISISVVASIVAIALVVLMAIYVKGIQRLQLSRARNSVQQLESGLVGNKDNVKVVTIQNQLQSLTSLENQKPVMSRTFGYLQSFVPTDVDLTSVKIDPSTTTITLNGSTDSYKSANAFADILKHASLSYKDSNSQSQTLTPFSAVVFSSLGGGSSSSSGTSGSSNSNSGVSFAVSFTYDSNLFSASISDPKITIPNLTSSQINQPSTPKASANNTSPFTTQSLTAPTSPATQNPTYQVVKP